MEPISCLKTASLRILFVNLPTIPMEDILACFKSKSVRRQTLSMPLGILYLSAAAKTSKFVEAVNLIDYVIKVPDAAKYESLDDFILSEAKANTAHSPNIVAFSLNFSASYGFFAHCVPLLRRLWPDALFIVGGIHATNTVRHLLQNRNIDFVFRGEGELAIKNFTDRVAQKQPIAIKGVYSRDSIDLQASPDLCDIPVYLDELPFPDWSVIDMEKYAASLGRQRNIHGEKKHASLMTTRGCCFQCTFCSTFSVHGRKVRFRSVLNVVAEIKYLHQNYGITMFMPEDDLITVNHDWLLRLMKELKGLNIPDLELQFPDALSVNTLNETILDALIEAGMKICVLAIESGSEHVQRRVIKKNCDLTKARNLVSYVKSRGIVVRCYYIFGFPGETIDQMKETLEFAKSLKADWSVFNIATPLVGSEMYKLCVEAGYIEDAPETWAGTMYDRRVFDTKEISAKDLNDFVYRANLDCNFIHNPNIVEGNFEKAINIFEDILSKHEFHIIALYCIAECYKNLRRETECRSTYQKIRDLIDKDPRAAKMFEDYGNLMKSFLPR